MSANLSVNLPAGAGANAGVNLGMFPLLARVAHKHLEARDICSFELVSGDGQPLPPFTAGSHIDVRLPGGQMRKYSLCNDPAEQGRYVIAVLRDPQSRGGSVALHETVHVGDVLRIGRPKNFFRLAEDAPHSLLLAGGIGITPILSMAERLSGLGAGFELHVCMRSIGRMAFRERIGASRYAQRTVFHFDDGADGQKLDLAATLNAVPPGTHVYVCGPGGFIRFVTESARNAGWSPERIHFEFFGAQPAS